MERWVKPSFTVIGKEGSTDDGADFVARLWEEANGHFAQVAPLAKTNPDGSLAGVWGTMTDMARCFQPWEDGFTRGLYLAGVECADDAQPPEGWVRWDVPGFEYVRIPNDGPEAFPRGLELLQEAGLSLAGAVQEYNDAAAGVGYLCYPIRRLTKEDEV
nr:GyrI-like domain-containing protein [Clostridia bacterium]